MSFIDDELFSQFQWDEGHWNEATQALRAIEEENIVSRVAHSQQPSDGQLRRYAVSSLFLFFHVLTQSVLVEVTVTLLMEGMGHP